MPDHELVVLLLAYLEQVKPRVISLHRKPRAKYRLMTPAENERDDPDIWDTSDIMDCIMQRKEGSFVFYSYDRYNWLCETTTTDIGKFFVRYSGDVYWFSQRTAALLFQFAFGGSIPRRAPTPYVPPR